MDSSGDKEDIDNMVNSVWNKSNIDNEAPGDCDETVPLPDEDDNEPDPAWNTGAASSPAKPVYPSEPINLNISLWSLQSSPSRSEKIDFTCQRFEEFSHFGSLPILSQTKTRSSTIDQALTTPHDIAFSEHLNVFIVPEPYDNRVGIYDAEWQFQYWLAHPKIYENWKKPSDVLCLKNGIVVILERTKIQFFTEKLEPLMYKFGHFYGLAEGPDSQLYTMTYLKNKRLTIQRLLLRANGFYGFAGQIDIEVLSAEEKTRSHARFLVCNNNKIFITDLGAHRLITVDSGSYQ